MKGEKLNMKNIKKIKPWLYSIPALLLTVIIVLVPIVYTGYISFTNMNLYHWFKFDLIGFENYKRALLKVDTGFISAVFTTVLWTIFNMVIQVVVAYFIALGLNAKGLKLGRIYKTLLMFPWAMPAYVSILLWRVGIYNTEFGLLNKLFKFFGMAKRNVLAQNGSAFIACMVLNLWMALPFMIMMIDGALQSIEKSYYESAKLDGAGFWKQNFYITIPSLKQVVLPAIIMTTFTTFKQFDIIYLLTRQKGSLSGSSFQTIITYAHEKAFVSNNYGLSAAVSMIIFVIILIFSLYTNRGIKGDENA